MTKTITYNFKHKCPHLNRIHSISIDYGEINMLGSLETHYKKMNYFCNEAPECSFKDSYGRCPVYLAAPSRPR
ncbi:hypothetical protein G8V06_09420 [Clostridium botulinum D/C]|uniref:hypothetical protein n=1 Tax=Clostridium botulinum TaxID=1491 RepID=UPI001E4C5F73|nr:hypothetical protein [Clostridium botulinum]MCD3206788.1 hypothetical protein [Clostridium botulinum C]MCD3209557.1 hypothetical protein [Clostridium botulinum C]MCD3226588.1 hypothetical protein [Clostridium botulinum C]MCD3234310.1 hypothetical protein [Clostridium botulinum D/C]MCD3240294.1 hypothetical protein [Clostridium botulinum D/C]